MKEKRMVIVVKQKENCTSFETIGDDLEKELRAYYLRQMEQEMKRAKIID